MIFAIIGAGSITLLKYASIRLADTQQGSPFKQTIESSSHRILGADYLASLLGHSSQLWPQHTL